MRLTTDIRLIIVRNSRDVAEYIKKKFVIETQILIKFNFAKKKKTLQNVYDFEINK